jgi:hypothetical protein
LGGGVKFKFVYSMRTGGSFTFTLKLKW